MIIVGKKGIFRELILEDSHSIYPYYDGQVAEIIEFHETTKYAEIKIRFEDGFELTITEDEFELI